MKACSVHQKIFHYSKTVQKIERKDWTVNKLEKMFTYVVCKTFGKEVLENIRFKQDDIWYKLTQQACLEKAAIPDCGPKATPKK